MSTYLDHDSRRVILHSFLKFEGRHFSMRPFLKKRMMKRLTSSVFDHRMNEEGRINQRVISSQMLVLEPSTTS